MESIITVRMFRFLLDEAKVNQATGPRLFLERIDFQVDQCPHPTLVILFQLLPFHTEIVPNHNQLSASLPSKWILLARFIGVEWEQGPKKMT